MRDNLGMIPSLSCPPLAALAVAFSALLLGCASAPTGLALSDSPWAAASQVASAHKTPAHGGGWEHLKLPGKSQVQFLAVRSDGRDALGATAVSAASVVRHRVRIEPSELANLQFSWKVPQLMLVADMALREADDSPVRVMLAFEGDRQRFSAKDSALSELMRSVSGEEMPYATLMYVWCNKRDGRNGHPEPADGPNSQTGTRVRDR